MPVTTVFTEYLEKVKANFSSIDEERKIVLEQVRAYVDQKAEANAEANLILICTHNSRRSHFSQIWAQIAADYYGFDFVKTFSGGTEATAFNPNAVKAIKDTGLEVAVDDESASNPVYTITYGEGKSLKAYSKVFDAPENPQSDFMAVMTCDHVDENCPFVPGAVVRIPLYYIDPKVSDGTPEQEATYAERCFQIATEFFYAFSDLKK